MSRCPRCKFRVNGAKKTQLRSIDVQSKFLVKLTYGALHDRVPAYGVLTPDMSPSPDYDLLMQGIVFGFLSSSKTQNIAATIANHDDGYHLHEVDRFLDTRSGQEFSLTSEKIQEFRRAIFLNRGVVTEHRFYNRFWQREDVLLELLLD